MKHLDHILRSRIQSRIYQPMHTHGDFATRIDQPPGVPEHIVSVVQQKVRQPIATTIIQVCLPLQDNDSLLTILLPSEPLRSAFQANTLR